MNASSGMLSRKAIYDRIEVIRLAFFAGFPHRAVHRAAALEERQVHAIAVVVPVNLDTVALRVTDRQFAVIVHVEIHTAAQIQIGIGTVGTSRCFFRHLRRKILAHFGRDPRDIFKCSPNLRVDGIIDRRFARRFIGRIFDRILLLLRQRVAIVGLFGIVVAIRKRQDQEGQHAQHQVEPQRRHITRAPAGEEFARQHAGFEEQRHACAPEPRVQVEERGNRIADDFGHCRHVRVGGLAAIDTEAAAHSGAAVEAVRRQRGEVDGLFDTVGDERRSDRGAHRHVERIARGCAARVFVCHDSPLFLYARRQGIHRSLVVRHDSFRHVECAEALEPRRESRHFR